MKRSRDKRAQRFTDRNRAAAEEQRVAAAQRAAAEEQRVAAAQRAAADEVRAAAAVDEVRAAAAVDEVRAAAAVVPPVPGGPAVPAAAGTKRSVPQELYKSSLGKPNSNRVPEGKVKGRQWMPLPAGAPKIEGTFYKLRKEEKTGNPLVDILMEEIYDDCLNDVSDKRRELLHYLSSTKKDDNLEKRLASELDGLMQKANNKIKELAVSTGHLFVLPDYLLKYPALRS